MKGDLRWRRFEESLDEVEEEDDSLKGGFIKGNGLCFESRWGTTGLG